MTWGIVLWVPLPPETTSGTPLPEADRYWLRPVPEDFAPAPQEVWSTRDAFTSTDFRFAITDPPTRAFVQGVSEIGIPFRAMAWTATGEVEPRQELILEGTLGSPPARLARTENRLLPWRPLWPGFLLNTLIAALLLWIVTGGISATRRAVRAARGRCPFCAYPIGASPRCSECGRTLPVRR